MCSTVILMKQKQSVMWKPRPVSSKFFRNPRGIQEYFLIRSRYLTTGSAEGPIVWRRVSVCGLGVPSSLLGFVCGGCLVEWDPPSM